LDVRYETAQKVQSTCGRSTCCPHRAPLVHPERSPRRLRPPLQSARNRVVMVIQAVPKHEHPVHVHPRHHSQTTLQNRSVRCLPIPRAVSPTHRRRSRRRHPLRPNPEHGPTLRVGVVVYLIRRRRGVRGYGRELPRLDTRRPRPPPTISLAMATAFRPPMDIHLNHGLLGLPLAPNFPA